MELPVDTRPESLRQVPLSDEWDAAFQRVESYLHAMHIRNRPVLNHLVQRIIEQAVQRVEQGDARPPVEVAGEETMHALARWFRSVLPSAEGEAEDDLLVRGRLALIMSRLTPERQAFVLSEGVQDPSFVEELRRAYHLTGPNFEEATMRARPLDLGVLTRAADRALAGLDRRPRMRMILLWALLLALFGLIFYYTR